jgi:hypothetical protein
MSAAKKRRPRSRAVAKRKRNTITVYSDPYVNDAPSKRARKARELVQAAATPGDKRGQKATPQIEAFIGQWKRTYIASRQADQDLELARTLVNGAFDANAVEYFITEKYGTISRGFRSGKVITDWKAMLYALLPPEVIAQHIEAYTTSEPGKPVLVAPSGWTAEAGC